MLLVLECSKPIWIYPVEKHKNDWNFSGSEFEHTKHNVYFLLVESEVQIHNPYPSQYMDGSVRNWSVFLHELKLIALPPNYVRMLKELKDFK
jgi:hypothetical protein